MGIITTQFTVWCSKCSYWYQEDIKGKAAFVKLVKKLGWKKIGKLWVCPNSCHSYKGEPNG